MKDLKQLKKDYDKLGETIAKMEGAVFERPVYRMHIGMGYILEFTGYCFSEVVLTNTMSMQGGWMQGNKYTHVSFNDNNFKGCEKPEKPKWKPTEPTWCWCSNLMTTHCKRLVIDVMGDSYVAVDLGGGVGGLWQTAEPCDIEDIPQWFKDMKC